MNALKTVIAATILDLSSAEECFNYDGLIEVPCEELNRCREFNILASSGALDDLVYREFRM